MRTFWRTQHSVWIVHNIIKFKYFITKLIFFLCKITDQQDNVSYINISSWHECQCKGNRGSIIQGEAGFPDWNPREQAGDLHNLLHVHTTTDNHRAKNSSRSGKKKRLHCRLRYFDTKYKFHLNSQFKTFLTLYLVHGILIYIGCLINVLNILNLGHHE